MNEVTVIVEQIDESIIVEVNPINDEVTVIIGSVVNQVGGVTDLSEGTATDITVNVDSSTGTNATLQPASATRAGLLTKAKFGEIGVNSLKVGVTNQEENTINTELEAGMTGEDLVLNVLSLTQAEYDAGTPIATTFYIITD